MYNNFYGFKKNPFTHTFDADFLYLSEKHLDILSSLKDGLSNHLGMMVLTGDMGTGKSILAKSLLSQLDQNYTAAILKTTQYPTLEEMLKNIFVAFDIKNYVDNSTELSNLLVENFLTSEFSNGKKVLLVIDNAQNLSVEQLENIRLLSNFTIDNHKVIQFILIGQKTLIDSLKIPELGQLINSVSLFEELPPLNILETKKYILHRIKASGSNSKKTFFTQRAYDSIYLFSGGIPALIDHICELSLISAFHEKIKLIDSELIEAVASGKESGTIQLNEHSVVYTNQKYQFPEFLHSPKKLQLTAKEQENTLEIEKVEHHTIVENIVITLPEANKTSSKEETLAEVDELDSKEETLAEIDEVNSQEEETLAEIIKDGSIEISQQVQRKEEAGRKNNNAIKNNYKIISQQIITAMMSTPNKRVVSSLALFCLVTLSVFLYTKSSPDTTKTLSEAAVSSKQTDTAEKNTNSAEDGIQLAGTTSPDPEMLIIPKNSTEAIVFTAPSAGIKEKNNFNSDATSSSLTSEKKNTNIEIDNSQDNTPVIVAGIEADYLDSGETVRAKNPQSAAKKFKNIRQIKKLLRLAKRQLRRHKLTTPRNYNAFSTYKRILELDPEYEPALEGLKKIKDLYLFWAERDIKRNRFEQAKIFINKGLRVDPDETQFYLMLDSIEQIDSTNF